MNKTTIDKLIYTSIAFLIIFIPVLILTLSFGVNIESSLAWSFGIPMATTFPGYHLIKMVHKEHILKKYWDKMILSCEYFEKKDYSFYYYGYKSDHWWELHKFISKFNKLPAVKNYTRPFTYHMGQRELLTKDTALIIKHMYNEVNYLNALNIDSLKISSIPLYDNTIIERNEIIKRRWELFLTYLNIHSEEYKELKLKYDEKFGIKTVKEKLIVLDPKVTEIKKSVDHLNQDMM